MGWVSATPRPLYPREREPVPIVQEAVWATGPVWRGAEKIPSPEFDPRTFQAVASLYAEWAIPAPLPAKWANILKNRPSEFSVRVTYSPLMVHFPRSFSFSVKSPLWQQQVLKRMKVFVMLFVFTLPLFFHIRYSKLFIQHFLLKQPNLFNLMFFWPFIMN